MAYVYRFKDLKGDIIYVGYTAQTLEKRMKQHWERGHLPRQCYNNVSKIEFIEYNTQSDAMIMETYFINKYKPVFNKLSKQLDRVTLPFNIDTKWKTHKILKNRKRSYAYDNFILKVLYIANFIAVSIALARYFNLF